jgi:hypothetical protein
VGLKEEYAITSKSVVGFPYNASRVERRKTVEFSIEKHNESKVIAILCCPNIVPHVLTGNHLLLSLLNGIGN